MILNHLFRAATPENPSFNLNSPQAWDMFTAGSMSNTGLTINRDKAMTFSPWWRGKNLIARDAGKLPLHIYRRKGEGKDRFTDHQAYSIFRRKANQYQTALQFKMTLTGHAMDGNGYGYIYRRKSGEIIPVSEGGGIYCLDPTATTPVRVNGDLWYVTTIHDGTKQEQRKLPAADVFHIKGLGFDGLVGYDVVMMAREALGLGVGRKMYEAKFFKNDARPSVVLEAPATVPEPAAKKILDGWNSMAAGLENAHKTALLTHGTKASMISKTARESQLAEGNEMSVRDIANFLGIPSHKLGDKKNTSYASLEIEQLSYLTEGLDFWLCVWESEIWDKCLTEEEKESDEVFAEFAREKLFETDLQTKGEFFRVSLGGSPWMTKNEARSAFNLNPVEGGDEIETPLNMGQGGKNNEEPKPGQPPAKDKGPALEDDDEEEDAARLQKLGVSIRANLEESVRRMVCRISKDAERAAKKPEIFLAWLDDVPEIHGHVVREHLRPAVDAAKEYNAITKRQPGAGAAAQQPLGDWLLETVRSELLEFAGRVSAKTMAAGLKAELVRLEADLPGRAAGYFLGA